MSEILNKIISAQGGYLNLILGIILFISLFFWLYLVLYKKDIKSAFYLQIILLPATFKSLNLIGITVYTKTQDYTDILGLTTIGILILFLTAKFLYKYKSPITSIERKIIQYYIIYASIGTISQFINHSFLDAFWLSFLGYWQYLLYMYLIFTFIKDYNDVEVLLKVLIVSMLFGILVRVFNDGYLFVPNFKEIIMKRAGTNSAFGKLGQYGCYLSMMLYIIFYFIIKSTGYKKLLWAIIFVAIFFEMVGNYTRGAILQLVFFIFLPFLTIKKKEVLILYLISFLIVIFAVGPFLYHLISVRGLELNINFFTSDSSASTRYELWQMNFPLIWKRWGIGYGIALEPTLFVGRILGGDIFLPSHNFLITEAERSGVYAILFFIVFLVKILAHLFKKIFADRNAKNFTFTPFLFLSLLSWIFYAQTSSLTITYYETIEGTLILFTLLSVSIIETRSNINNLEDKISYTPLGIKKEN